MDLETRAHDQVLVLRCQADDRDAFSCLYARYHGPLKYYLRRLLDSPQTADDVLQTVWLKALTGIRQLRNTELFRPWLYRVARNEAFQHLRRDRRWVEIEMAEGVPESTDETEDDFSKADAVRVHAALAELSPVHREVLVLRFLEDLSYQEMGVIVGCDLGTIRSRLHYAKRALRHVLEEHNHDD
jgi:RNA polymerase sigma-70 factor, ECF subfamily